MENRLIYQLLLVLWVNEHNKRFKTDSQRLAASVWFGFCVYGVIIEFRDSVAHHLSGRYMPLKFWRPNGYSH